MHTTIRGAEIVAARPHASAASHKSIRSASGMRAADSATAKRYFVEFRARNAASYGHMYVMYGEVNARREIIRSETAGFFPAGDSRNCVNCSVYNWTIGHVLPVPSEIGASDGDLEEQYVLARFRVWIDAAQYQSLVAYIRGAESSQRSLERLSQQLCDLRTRCCGVLAPEGSAFDSNFAKHRDVPKGRGGGAS